MWYHGSTPQVVWRKRVLEMALLLERMGIGIIMPPPTDPILLSIFDELRGERVLVRPYRESDAEAHPSPIIPLVATLSQGLWDSLDAQLRL